MLLALMLLASGAEAARSGEGSPMAGAYETMDAAGIVRLHVVAQNDAPDAQALKLKVRDAVLEAARVLLAECDDAQQACAALADSLPALEALAVRCARENGCTAPVTARMGVFHFPERDYGGITVPEGDYRALRIIIGEGEGRNWWCVLFPGLCLPVQGERSSLVAAWLREWFGGDRG